MPVLSDFLQDLFSGVDRLLLDMAGGNPCEYSFLLNVEFASGDFRDCEVWIADTAGFRTLKAAGNHQAALIWKLEPPPNFNQVTRSRARA